MTEFAFDTARDIAMSVLSRWKTHRDFDDLVSETLLAAWKASETRPELALPLVVTCAAKWQVKEWFRSKRCGDLLSGDRRERVNVMTMPWTNDGAHQIELSATQPDFADALIERIVAPPQPVEEDEEPCLTARQQKRQNREQAKQQRAAAYAAAREKDRLTGEDLLARSDLLSYYREAVRLHYCEGWSMRKAAEQMGLTQRAVNEAIRNSRRRMEARSA